LTPVDTSILSAPFTRRHIGPSPEDQAVMLKALGVASIDDLVSAVVPPTIVSTREDTLAESQTEFEVLARLRHLAARNRPLIPMIGLGYHGTITPAPIRRNVLENPSWYTAYTPYQPEISQGRLEALLNFQTMVADLTGLPVANASLLDEASAAAEAMTLIRRANRAHADGVFILDADTLPQTRAVLETRARALDIEIVVADLGDGLPDLDRDVCGVLVSYPGASGRVADPSPLIQQAHDAGALVAVATDLLACTMIEAPGTLDADVVIGSSQRFGVPLFYGGPHAGFMSVRDGLERQLPGRLVGVSVDADGHPAYRLALQTREQHIRRDKATSNICTAQVLLAVTASMYAVYHGPDGLRRIAERVHAFAGDLADRLAAGGVDVTHDSFFDTVRVNTAGRAADVVATAHDAGIHLWADGTDAVLVSCSELTTPAHIDAVLGAFGVDPAPGADQPDTHLSTGLRRETTYLTHPVFHDFRSETELMRYMKRLADRDYALDRGMIPLGSCTMKLNAAAEMEPISMHGFADLHPFVPAADAEGYRVLIDELEAWLAGITGYAAVSVQPNAGSQGELAGLLAIKAYHEARGESARDVCLIPSSAHGTNAASAVLAGMRVAVVKAGSDGSVDMDDLGRQCAAHDDDLAAIMVTYPSTHGAYEDTITDLCAVVHEHGGQVYVDGANLNALLGVARPGQFGGDVSHLNLHKTFCIPHGGGGPGVGPIAVGEHLASYLPSHPLHPDEGRRDGIGPVSAAPYGSAGILPISWAYLALMGSRGLREATSVAVLSANYIAHRLNDHFPVLYRGHGGFVAHECILDVREATRSSGVTVDDVAKRLIDYGFHAPTMSFPVAGTLMVEPTESESLRELDRFVDAMIAIRAEIAAVEDGDVEVAASALRHAPHTTRDLVGDWDRGYGRLSGAYPAGFIVDKYLPPVRRVDQAYGDRHLVCSCPDPSAFAED
jgi:glycine dehydrogenase